MSIESFKDPIVLVLTLESQVDKSESLDATIINGLEDLIQNWEQIPSDRCDKDLRDELLNLSNKISEKFNTEEGKKLANNIRILNFTYQFQYN